MKGSRARVVIVGPPGRRMVRERSSGAATVARQRRHIEALEAGGALLGRSLHPDDVYDSLRDLLSGIMPCDALFVTAYVARAALIRCQFAWVEGSRLAPDVLPALPLNTGKAGNHSQVILSGESLLVSNLLTHPRGVGYFVGGGGEVSEQRLPDSPGPGSSITVPLRLAGEIVGTLQVQSTRAGAYTTEDLRLLEGVAGQVAAAERNARLYQQALREVEERRQAEEALRRSQEQLRQAQKLEAVGRLAGGIAHDFNNMLAVINGYSALALGSLDRDSALHSYVEEIRRAGDRAAALTQQLLAFSRRQMLEPRVLDLNEVLAGTHSMLRHILGEDIDLVVSPGRGLAHVRADPGQVDQVLVNLAVNGRDAMPEGGRLTLSTANVRLEEQRTDDGEVIEGGEYVLLSVADTGCGIPPEDLPRIFEPFFTTKEPGKGTGLGLSMLYGFVRQSDGHVSVQSEIGIGTTVRIYLPAIRDAPERPAALAPPALRKGSGTVLVVEDEPLVLGMVRQILTSCGYDVLTAESGPAALELAASHPGPIRLLLTDFVMPGMSGGELSERLLAQRPEMRVLLMSGYSEDTRVRQRLGESRAGFIEKPFSPADLAARVAEALAPGEE
jgi:signal transduction histidine kinase